MMTKASAYWKLLLDGQLIGGAIVFSYPRGRYYLARIFLDPDYFRQGHGLRAMDALLAAAEALLAAAGDGVVLCPNYGDRAGGMSSGLGDV